MKIHRGIKSFDIISRTAFLTPWVFEFEMSFEVDVPTVFLKVYYRSPVEPFRKHVFLEIDFPFEIDWA